MSTSLDTVPELSTEHEKQNSLEKTDDKTQGSDVENLTDLESTEESFKVIEKAEDVAVEVSFPRKCPRPRSLNGYHDCF